MKVVTVPEQRRVDIVNILEDWLVKAKAGELKSLVLCGEHAEGNFGFWMSQCNDQYSLAGQMMTAALVRMGFRQA